MNRVHVAIAHLTITVATVACASAQAADRRQASAPLETVEVFGNRIDGLALGETASTGSRLGLAPLDTPASVEVLAGGLIRERGDLNIVEAVTRATGITSEATPGDGGTALSTRGFAGHSSVMQLFDGSSTWRVRSRAIGPKRNSTRCSSKIDSSSRNAGRSPAARAMTATSSNAAIS
jgi:outer membrane receptor for monomeric catechols